MKRIFLAAMSSILCITLAAQRPQIRKGVHVKKYSRIEQNSPGVQAEKRVTSSPAIHPKVIFDGQPGSITVIDLGTSGSLEGYSRGTRTMLWADNDLNTVVNIHRLGPGTTPPGLDGYLGMDIGINRGMAPTDWTTQV